MAIIGTGFGSGETVSLVITSPSGDGRSIGTAQTDGQGGFNAEVALPKDMPLGAALLVATGTASQKNASVDITVVLACPSGSLRSQVSCVVVLRAQSCIYSLPSANSPEATTQPDANGQYTFSNLASGFNTLSATSSSGQSVGPYNVQLDGTANDIKKIDLVIPQSGLSGLRPRALDCRHPSR